MSTTTNRPPTKSQEQARLRWANNQPVPESWKRAISEARRAIAKRPEATLERARARYVRLDPTNTQPFLGQKRAA